jgi:hypothetical protein
MKMNQPGIVTLLSATSTNAWHLAFHTAAGDEPQPLLLLQNAASLPLIRQVMSRGGPLNDFQFEKLAAMKAETDLANVPEKHRAPEGNHSRPLLRKTRSCES